MGKGYKLVYTTGMGITKEAICYHQRYLTKNVNTILKNKKYDPGWSVVEIQIIER